MIRVEENALAEVGEEIDRQHRLKMEGRFAFVPSDKISPSRKLSMLVEEVGEAARHTLADEGIVQEKPNILGLRKELIQVAAIATSWASSL